MARLLVSTVLFIVGKIMRRLICLLTMCALASCTAIRNSNTYNLELTYIQQGLDRQGKLVHELIKKTCCRGTEFKDSLYCNSMADTHITVKNRTPYHLAMMRYLGRLTDERPELPVIDIDGGELCE